MSLFLSIAKRFARLYGMDSALERLDESFQLGQGSNIQIPKEIVAEALEFASRGLLNMNAIQPNLDWVMPYWVNKQYNKDSDSYVPGTVLSTNQTHRNWTAIGCLDSAREPVVDPTGLLTPWFDGWSVEFWVRKNGYLILPSMSDDIYQYLVKQLPIVVSQFIKKDLRLKIEAFASVIGEHEYVLDALDLVNLESVPVKVEVYAALRPYNPEGISPVGTIEYEESQRLFRVNGSPGLYLPASPDRVYCSNRQGGDASFALDSAENHFSTECPQGLATAFARFDVALRPGEARQLEVRAPVEVLKKQSPPAGEVYAEGYQNTKRVFMLEWDNVMRRGMRVELPFQKMQNSFYANKAHLYLFIDGDIITPGPFTYHHEWFRDAAYSVPMLDKLGYHDEAERILLNYPNRQRRDGYFLSQEGEWDANGQALWTYWQHYRFTRKRDFLEAVFPSALKGLRWIQKNRVQSNGLLPAGFSAEHFGPNDTFYWDNFWALGGIEGFIGMAEVLGREKQAAEARSLLDEYRKAVFASIDADQERFPGPIIPPSPNRSADASIIGAVCALYPLRLVDPRDPRMTGTLRAIREKYMQNHAFFHRVTHSGYNVYLTAQMAQCYLFRRSARVLPILQWIMNNISPTGTFPEAIHPVTGGGCYGDGHHGWAAADFLSLLRNMLLFEEGRRLVLLPVAYHRWMDADQRISVSDAPSEFGTVSYTVLGEVDRIVLKLDCSFSDPPDEIEFSSPFPVSSAQVDGSDALCEGGTLIFPPDAREVILFR
jgi:hypothetical protein